MYNPIKIIYKIKSTVIDLFSLNIITLKRTLFLILLSFTVTIFDALSIVSVMPLIQFVQYGLDVNVFIFSTKYGEKLYNIFYYLGFTFNLQNLATILVSLILIRQCLIYLLFIEKQKTTLKMAKDLSIKCFMTIMKASAEYIRKMNTGQFTILTEFECLQVTAVYTYMLNFVGLIAQISFYTLTMMFVSFGSTIVALFIMFIIGFMMLRFIHKVNIEAKAVVNIRKNFYNSLSEEFSMWRLIKFHSVDKDITNNILPISENYEKSQLRIEKYREKSKLFILISTLLRWL